MKAQLKPTGLAVGFMPDVNYEIQQTQLDAGDTLLIFTDGVIEAKDLSGKSFGRKRLLELLEKPALSATALLSQIETNLHAHMAGAAQVDDIAGLAISRPA